MSLYRDYLSGVTPEGNRNNGLHGAAVSGIRQGLPLFPLIEQAERNGLPAREIQSCISSAERYCHSEGVEPKDGKATRESNYVPQKKERVISFTGRITAPPRPNTVPMPDADWEAGRAVFINTLFADGDQISICTKGADDENKRPVTAGSTWTVDELFQPNLEIAYEPSNGCGTWVRVNAMMPGGKTDLDVAHFVHCLIESDCMTIEEQYTMLLASRLPIATIVHSGGKSLHALVRVDAADREQYVQRVNVVYAFMRQNGFDIDEQNKNPSRYSRLPGVLRGDMPQYLVAVNPAGCFGTYDEWVEWAQMEDTEIDVTAFRGEHLPDDWLTQFVPPIEFVFHNMIPLDYVTLLVATGGTGKSMLSLELAMSVTLGRILLEGINPCTTEPSRVAMLALEDDKAEIWRRLQRIGRTFGLDDKDAATLAQNLRLFCMPTFAAVTAEKRGAPLAVSDDLQRLSDELKDFEPRLVIFDPLAALLGGVVEENSNEAAYAVVGLLRSSLPPGTGLLVLCHTSKAERSTSETPRGAAGWLDAVRQKLALRPPDDIESPILGHDAAQTVVFDPGKSNYCASPPLTYLRRVIHPELGGVLVNLDYAAYKKQAAEAKVAGVSDAVLKLLPNHDVTLQEVKGDYRRDDPEAKRRGLDFWDAVNDALDRKVARKAITDCVKSLVVQKIITQRLDGKRKVLVLPSAVNENADFETGELPL